MIGIPASRSPAPPQISRTVPGGSSPEARGREVEHVDLDRDPVPGGADVLARERAALAQRLHRAVDVHDVVGEFAPPDTWVGVEDRDAPIYIEGRIPSPRSRPGRQCVQLLTVLTQVTRQRLQQPPADGRSARAGPDRWPGVPSWLNCAIFLGHPPAPINLPVVRRLITHTGFPAGSRKARLITVRSVSREAVRRIVMAGQAEVMFASDVASRSLGMELLRVAPGTAEVRMRITRAMVNGYDIAHGGYLFMLADTAFACACNSHGQVTVAAGAEISFVTSARLGDELVATAEMRTRYGRNGIYDVTIRRDHDVIAEFRGRSRAAAPERA
jgi:acyl-CoA thioesterase